MIIICGKTIAEVERDLELAKAAIATGAPMGVGGATMADVEQAMRGLRQTIGADNAPISNPNYVGVPPIEDEHEEIEVCPMCENDMSGGICEHCGYSYLNGAGEEDPCEECEGECEGCDNYDEDGNHSTDPADDFIKWLEDICAPADIIAIAKGMFGK